MKILTPSEFYNQKLREGRPATQEGYMDLLKRAISEEVERRLKEES